MLTTTLETEHVDDGLRCVLALRNDGDDPVELSFRNSKRADFVAFDGEEEVWRWSDGRMFAQALGSETVDAGATVEFEGVWPDPPSGEYRVVGEVAASDRALSAETTVSI